MAFSRQDTKNEHGGNQRNQQAEREKTKSNTETKCSPKRCLERADNCQLAEEGEEYVNMPQQFEVLPSQIAHAMSFCACSGQEFHLYPDNQLHISDLASFRASFDRLPDSDHCVEVSLGCYNWL